MLELSELKQQAVTLWNNLDRQARVLIGVLGAITLFTIIFLVTVTGRTDYAPLFTSLSLEDAARITECLDELNIPYELRDEGRTILAPADRIHGTRIKLAGEGLPRHGVVGFEIFDHTELGTTDFERQVNLHRAIQGELTRTIIQMNEIEKARVHISQPRERLYLEDQRPLNASVMISLRPGAGIGEDQVRSISNLVAGSVENLEPENVTILDTQGRLFSQKFSIEGLKRHELSSRQLEIKRGLEREMEESLQAMFLPVFGHGNVVVRVSAELDFDEIEKESELFEPVVGDQGILRSVEESEEYHVGTGPAGELGIPGVESNIPTYEELEAGDYSYERRDLLRNYEINRSVIREHTAPGQVERLSVAVMINEDLNPAEIDELRGIVSSAAGINPGRGDQVTITGTRFVDLVEEEVVVEEPKPLPLSLILAGAVLLVALLLLYALRSRRAREEEEAERILEEVEEETAAEEEELSPEERERQRIQEEVRRLVQNKPEDVAQLLKSWLTEE